MSVIFKDLTYTLTARQLLDSERAISAWIGDDLQQSTRFGLLCDNGVPWAVVDRVLHQSNALNVPLPRHFTQAQLAHVIDDAGLDQIITDAPDVLTGLPGDWICRDTGEFGLQRWVRTNPLKSKRSLPAGTRKITYTSGSTGQPKGVCLSKEAMNIVVNSLANVLRPLQIERHLCLLPLSTLLDNLVSIHIAPALGVETVLPSLSHTGVGYGGLDIATMRACIEQYAPGSMLLVPELLRVLVVSVAMGWRVPTTFKFIAVGGASVSPDLLSAAHAVGLPAYEGYGLSECASVVALNTPGAERKGSVGRVLSHAAVRVDENDEIHVRGATMLGYFGDAEPASDEIATGDLGFIDDDGFLYVRGRCKNMLITSLGRNVSPEWVERELLASPAVGQAVVFGEARAFLSALIYPSRATVSVSDLSAAVATANRSLPEYAQIRRFALLSQPLRVEDGAITTNGRTRREVVLERYRNLIEELYVDAIAS